MTNQKLLFNTFIVAIFSASCTAPKLTAIKEVVPLPDSYEHSNTADTNTVARLHYKEFFKDPNLTALIEEVLANNLDNKIAKEKIKIATAYLEARRGALLPSVTAGIRASGTHYGKRTMEGVGNFDTNLSSNIDNSQQIPTFITPDYWLGLSASWEIDLWGKLSSLKDAAWERLLATLEGRELLNAALITHTATLYYELIMLDKEVNILQQNIELQEKALEVIKIHKEVGRATELAVQQFDAQLANTKASLYGIKQEIVAAENKIQELKGNYQNDPIQRSSSIDTKSVNYLAQHGNPRQLLEYRPDIRMAYHGLQASHADAKAARAAFFPSLSLGSFVGFNSFNAEKFLNPSSIAYQLIGGFSAPVFQRKQLQSEFNIASSEQEMAFLNYQKTVNSAFQEVKTLLSYISNNQNILFEKTKEVRALDKGISVSQDLYVMAYASYLEIISAQKSKINAEMDLIKTERNHVNVLIQLYKALGGGSDKNV